MRSQYSDKLVAEMTAGMQGVHLPSANTTANGNRGAQPAPAKREQPAGSKVDARSKTTLAAPSLRSRRPYDDIKAAGPAADPVDFSRPTIDRGRRGDVLCYNRLTGAHDVAKNVLFRDYSQQSSSDENLDRVQRAYWPLPYKHPIDTIMGHVSICLVLTRCTKESDIDSSSDDSDQESEEDIVFQTTTEYVAVKVNYCDRMERLKNKHAEDPLKEIAALQLIGNTHPNVLGCHEVLFDGANVNVVLPFCGSGDLFQLLQDNLRLSPDTPGLSESKARYWFRQVAAGIKHLHSIGVCHRDLSPENVMIDRDRCAVIDMGMCLRMPYTDPQSADAVTDVTRGVQRRMIKPQGTCGKLPYMSPEIYANKEDFDGGAIDVWTAGTILFCMVTGNRSYQKPHTSDPQFYWMTRGLTTLLKDWNVSLSPQGVHLLQNMLQLDPRLRLTIDEVLDHPWFQQPDDSMQDD